MVKVIQEDQWYSEYCKFKGVLVLDVYADWCGPCKRLGEFMEKIVPEYPTITFVKIDSDANPKFCDEFQIKSLPTVMVFKDGVKMETVHGFNPDKFVDLLLKYK